jgi:uncharacterized protein YegP (UPF0339 family)
MPKLIVKSTYKPIISEWKGKRRLYAGSIISVNGQQIPEGHYVWIGKKFNLSDIEWEPAFRSVPIPKSKQTFKVPSSKPGKFYNVVKYDNGKITCDCSGYMYRKKCKHISQV